MAKSRMDQGSEKSLKMASVKRLGKPRFQYKRRSTIDRSDMISML